MPSSLPQPRTWVVALRLQAPHKLPRQLWPRSPGRKGGRNPDTGLPVPAQYAPSDPLRSAAPTTQAPVPRAAMPLPAGGPRPRSCARRILPYLPLSARRAAPHPGAPRQRGSQPPRPRRTRGRKPGRSSRGQGRRLSQAKRVGMLPPMARLWHRREEGAARESAGGGRQLVTLAAWRRPPPPAAVPPSSPLPSLAAAQPSQGGGGRKLSRAGSPRPGRASPWRLLGIPARRALWPRRAPTSTPPCLPGPRAPTWRPLAPNSLRAALASARCLPAQRLRPVPSAVGSPVRPCAGPRRTARRQMPAPPPPPRTEPRRPGALQPVGAGPRTPRLRPRPGPARPGAFGSGDTPLPWGGPEAGPRLASSPPAEGIRGGGAGRGRAGAPGGLRGRGSRGYKGEVSVRTARRPGRPRAGLCSARSPVTTRPRIGGSVWSRWVKHV